LATAAAIAIVFVMVGGAWAAVGDTPVTANVLPKCVVTGSGTIAAFDINPDAVGFTVDTETASSSPTVLCTKGTAFTATCNPAKNGTGALIQAGDTPAGDIAYTVSACDPIYQTGTSTSGFNATLDRVKVGVTFADNAAANSAAGAHSGTITLTVAP